MRTRIAVPLLCVVALATSAAAQTKKAAPLTIKEQGSFFVGGEHKSITPPPGPFAAPGDITINQMYVQYQVPMKGDQHVPVVMVHGCCLSSKTWETTPDGRMGWSEYFLRKDRAVYLADQVSRARSGFDPTTFAEVRQGTRPPAQMPTILDATHQTAWTVFRFGPKRKTVHATWWLALMMLGRAVGGIVPARTAANTLASKPERARDT